MTLIEPVQADEVLGGLRVIDCDAHFTEPPDLWTARAATSVRDLMPKMKTAIEENDLAVVNKDAHAIKGACSMLFMSRLGLICVDLQEAALEGNQGQARVLFASLTSQYERAKDESLQILAQIGSVSG